MPVGVPQQLPVRRGMPLPAVLDQPGHKGRGDRLPADRLALLPQQDQALVGVQIRRRSASAPPRWQASPGVPSLSYDVA